MNINNRARVHTTLSLCNYLTEPLRAVPSFPGNKRADHFSLVISILDESSLNTHDEVTRGRKYRAIGTCCARDPTERTGQSRTGVAAAGEKERDSRYVKKEAE